MTSFGKTKVRKSDVAYQGLRNAIIKAELRPGAALEEQACMDLLGMGRTPIREALQRLAQEELVLSVPQRGYFVSSTSASDFFQLQEFRLHTEVLAVRLAAERITDAQLAQLDALIEEAHAGVDAGRMEPEWHLGIDEQMHQIIGEASTNAFLSQALTRLYALSVRSLYVSRIPVELLYDDLQDMVAITAALRAHDPVAAEAAMVAHLNFPATPLTRQAKSSVRETAKVVK